MLDRYTTGLQQHKNMVTINNFNVALFCPLFSSATLL
jgi:hypothetical protein